MTQSMKGLERVTEEAYAEVSSLRVDIKLTDDEARGLRNLVLIPLPFLIVLLVGVFMFAPWGAALGPLFVCSVLLTIGVRRLHWLRTVELPTLKRKYRRSLTEATEALQAQSERESMRLLQPEEYARLERENEEELRSIDEAREKQRRKEYEESWWDATFKGLLGNPYRGL